MLPNTNGVIWWILFEREPGLPAWPEQKGLLGTYANTTAILSQLSCSCSLESTPDAGSSPLVDSGNCYREL